MKPTKYPQEVLVELKQKALDERIKMAQTYMIKRKPYVIKVGDKFTKAEILGLLSRKNGIL